MEDNQNFCVQCGQYLAEDAKFCPSCGARVPGRNPDLVEQDRQAVRDVMKYRMYWAIALCSSTPSRSLSSASTWPSI